MISEEIIKTLPEEIKDGMKAVEESYKKYLNGDKDHYLDCVIENFNGTINEFFDAGKITAEQVDFLQKWQNNFK